MHCGAEYAKEKSIFQVVFEKFGGETPFLWVDFGWMITEGKE